MHRLKWEIENGKVEVPPAPNVAGGMVRECRDALHASNYSPRKTRDFLQPFQPVREENVVDRVFGTVKGGFGIQQSFFTQRVSKALHGGWGADFMFSQKIASCNLYDCAFFGNSDEESPLFFCQHLAILEVNRLPLLHQLGASIFYIVKPNIGSTVVINGVT